jgi:flavin reductase (DIM6/NTAB) family NADH-FMN oxidoreductase RutF
MGRLRTTAARVPAVAAPGGTGPIGPFPRGVETPEAQEEFDKLRRRVLWTMPSGLYVVGSRDGDRRNLMTLNWATQVSFDPKLLGIAVEKPAVTHELIAGGGSFTLCTVAREDRAIVRKFTKPVEYDAGAGTLNGFPFHEGRTGAPILDQAAAWIECEVRQAVDCGGHTFFVGEVVDAGFQRDEDTEVLRMEDTRMSYGG